MNHHIFFRFYLISFFLLQESNIYFPTPPATVIQDMASHFLCLFVLKCSVSVALADLACRYLLCRPGWPGTHSPASASQVQWLKAVYHHVPLEICFNWFESCKGWLNIFHNMSLSGFIYYFLINGLNLIWDRLQKCNMLFSSYLI